MSTPLLGLLIVVLAGALNGSFALPMKGTSRWAFENVWLVYSIIAMLVLNWGIAFYSVPDLMGVFQRAGIDVVLMVVAFGMIWGLANLMFGTGIHLIGISLTFPITLGLSTAFGSLLPMAQQPEVFTTPAGMATTVGIAVLLAGVYLCGVAGVRKDAQIRAAEGKDEDLLEVKGSRLIKGLAIVILAGFLDPCLNFAFAFGDRIKAEALASEGVAGAESDAIWALALLGSFVVNASYCTAKLTRERNWRKYAIAGTGKNWLLAALMAAIWMASVTLFGRGATAMGPLGDSVGWALFLSSIIIFSTLWGVLSGEWKGGAGRPLRTLYASLGVLIAAIAILGYGVSLS